MNESLEEDSEEAWSTRLGPDDDRIFEILYVLERQGVTHVKWSSAMDEDACKTCRDRNGAVMTTQEARNMLLEPDRCEAKEAHTGTDRICRCNVWPEPCKSDLFLGHWLEDESRPI